MTLESSAAQCNRRSWSQNCSSLDRWHSFPLDPPGIKVCHTVTRAFTHHPVHTMVPSCVHIMRALMLAKFAASVRWHQRRTHGAGWDPIRIGGASTAIGSRARCRGNSGTSAPTNAPRMRGPTESKSAEGRALRSRGTLESTIQLDVARPGAVRGHPKGLPDAQRELQWPRWHPRPMDASNQPW